MIPQPRKKVNYLNNANMLKEIHESKMSFCSSHDKKYFNYDVIVSNIEEITVQFLTDSIPFRTKRINTTTIRDMQKALNLTVKQCTTKMDQDSLVVHDADFTIYDIVVRVMTTEHVPEINNVPIRTNFKPFKHYVLDNDNNLFEVVRSHWNGTIDSGEFSMSTGRLTNNLGKMFYLLTDKIGTKANYRNYTYLDEMKCDGVFQLTKNALLFDESRKTVQLNPFAYYTTIVENAFIGVLNSEKRSRNIRDDLLEHNGFDPSNTRMIEIEQNIVNKHLK
jgi:hypothetical protein